MHKTKFWVGIILILLALLPSIGIVLNPALVFVGPLLVFVAALGGFLIVGSMGLSHGWKLWSGLLLFLLALLPSIGIVLIPALVFTGPLLVAVAALSGYLLARRHGR